MSTSTLADSPFFIFINKAPCFSCVWIVIHAVRLSSSDVRNYLKEALVNIIAVHAEVNPTYILLTHCVARPFITPWLLTSTCLCLRSSPSLRIWCRAFCRKLLSQLRMRCVASCSVCLPSAKMELCRYTQSHITDTEHFITHNKTLTHTSTTTLVGDLPIISDNAVSHFNLPTADSCMIVWMVFFHVNLNPSPCTVLRLVLNSVLWERPSPHT